MAKDIAYKLAEYAATLKAEDIPVAAVEATKRDLYDTLACGFAGPTAKGIRELMEFAEECGGAEQATTFVFGKKFPAQITAMLNTIMMHGCDYDDNHDTAMLHSGAVVIGSALAAAEMVGGVSGGDFLAAVTAGLDIHCRLGLASTVGIVESGWIFTTIMGVFGATAAAGRVLGLTPNEMLNAFGIAYSQAAGNYQAITDSAWTKRMQTGFCSRAAVTSAVLAKKGVIGAKNVFEGKYGLYYVYLKDRYDPAPLCEGIGKTFAHEDMAFKPWPCARPNQAPINACLEIREKYHPDPTQIRHVEIRMNKHLYVCACIPEDVRHHPTSIVEGQFSIPYVSACALVNGRVGLSDFTNEGIGRPDVLEVCAKIDGVIDDEIEKLCPAKVCPVKVTIEMNDGTIYEHYMEKTKGCMEKPMTDADFDAKMQDCIDFCPMPIPEGAGARVKALVYGIETVASSNELVQAMQAAE